MRILSLLLCLCFFTQNLRAQESGEVIRVTPEKMRELEKSKSTKTKKVILTEEEKEDPEKAAKKHAEPGYLDVFSGFTGGEEVIVVFAVIGVVMVIAWIATFPVMLYQVLKDPKKFEYQGILSTSFAAVSTRDSRNGSLYGLKYAFYLAPKGEDKFEDGHVGLFSEVGRYAFEDHEEGMYWVLGPSFLYGFNPFFLKMDLGAGSSFDSRFGLISKADLTFNFKLEGGLSLGIGYGLQYLRVKEDRGLIRSPDDVGNAFLVNLGYVF